MKKTLLVLLGALSLTSGTFVSAWAGNISSTKTLTVTSPNGGEVFAAGEWLPITWDYTGGGADFVNINIEYEVDGEQFIEQVADRVVNSGFFRLKLPDGLNLANVKVQVAANDLVSSVALDSSDSSFTIGNPVVKNCAADMFVKSNETGLIYYIDSNLIRHLVAADSVLSAWSPELILEVPDSEIASYPLGNNLFPNFGSLVRFTDDARVFMVVGDLANPKLQIIDPSSAIVPILTLPSTMFNGRLLK